MSEVGVFLSGEEHGPGELVAFAREAEEAGFRHVWVSDHYHPWISRQGQSPFVWSVLGGIAATTSLDLMTAVTCPTVRVHPAVLGQAAATMASMAPGRFRFGIGSGENLNEHILGDRWPPTDIRLAMLEEAVVVMRELWRGGEVSHHGRYYTVENARVYSLPPAPPPILVSGLGPKATRLAARIADGYVSAVPAGDLVELYEAEGGRGPKVSTTKVCWAAEEGAARRRAFELWPTARVPGELTQELRTPAHFEQATQDVTEDAVAEAIPCGPDPELHAENLRRHLDAGFDLVGVSQIGKDQAGFFAFYRKEVLPRLGL